MCATVLLAQLTTNDPLIERAESGCENPKGHILHWWLAEKRSCKLNYSDKQSLQGIRFNYSRIEEKQWVRLMLLVLLTICLEEIQTKSHPKKKKKKHLTYRSCKRRRRLLIWKVGKRNIETLRKDNGKTDESLEEISEKSVMIYNHKWTNMA